MKQSIGMKLFLARKLVVKKIALSYHVMLTVTLATPILYL